LSRKDILIPKQHQETTVKRIIFPLSVISIFVLSILYFSIELKSPPEWKDAIKDESTKTESSTVISTQINESSGYVLFLGDSWCVSEFTSEIAKVLNSYRVSKCAGSTGYLQDGVPKGCGNQCGNYLKQVEKINKWVFPKVKYVVVSTAGNDGPTLTTGLKKRICLTFRNLRLLMPKAQIFAIEPFYGYHGKDYYNDIPITIKQCAESQGGLYIQGSSDILTRGENWQSNFKPNDSHPTSAGSRLLGVEIAKAIKESLQSKN